MVYSPHPPNEILQTKLIDFFAMQRLRRFARYWDLVANSGNFREAVPAISNFTEFMKFSDWLYAKTKQTHAIARARLAELLGSYLGREITLKRSLPADLPARQVKHLT